ncbi:hypothetical protein ACI6GS_06475 [Zavarzinia sp. CC-PAN008]
MRDGEPAAGRPGVNPETALAPHRRDVHAVHQREAQAEARLHLILPLRLGRGRCRDDDRVDPPPEQQFARDQPRLDRFTQANVVGDEQVDAGQLQRLAQWFELVGVKANARTERRLEQPRVCRGDAVPAQRVEVGREPLGRVEAVTADPRPGFLIDKPGAWLMLPKHTQGFALGVILGAGKVHEGRLAGRLRARDALDDPLAMAHHRQGADVLWAHVSSPATH